MKFFFIGIRLFLLMLFMNSYNYANAQMTRKDSIQLSDKLFSEGVDFYQSERTIEAIHTFQKCDSLDAALNYRQPYAKMWLARCLASHGYKKVADKIYPFYYNVPPIDRRKTVESDRLVELAGDLMEKKRYGKAEKLLNKVREIEKDSLGDSCFYYANTLFTLGCCQINQGKNEEGITNLMEAKRIYQLQDGKDIMYFPILSELLNMLQQLYSAKGNKTQADSLALEEAQNLKDGVGQELFGGDTRQMFLYYYQIDSIYKHIKGEICIERAKLYSDWARHITLHVDLSEKYNNSFLKKYKIDNKLALDYADLSIYYWNQIPNSKYNEEYFEAGVNLAYIQKHNLLDAECEETVNTLRTLLTLYKEKDNFLYVKSLIHISDYYNSINQPEIAFNYLFQAKSEYSDSLSKKNQLYIDVIHDLGAYYLEKDDDLAFQLMKEAADLESNSHEEWIENTLKVYYTFLLLYKINYNNIHMEKYMKYMERYKNFVEEQFGNNSKEYANVKLSFGDAYIQIGKFYKAIEYTLSALDFYSEQTSVDSDKIYNCYRTLASCYSALGNKSKESEYLKRFVDLLTKLHGKYTIEYVNALITLGMNAYHDDSMEEAEKYLGEAVNLAKILNPNGQELILATCYYQWLLVEKSKNDINVINSSIKYIEDMISNRNHNVVKGSNALLVLGILYAKKNDWFNAISYYKMNIIENDSLGLPLSSSSLAQLAKFYKKLDLIDSVQYYTVKAFDIEKKHIQEEISGMTTSERETFWNDNEAFFSRTIPRHAYFCKSDTMSIIAFNSALTYKGFLLCTEIELNKLIFESGDSILLRQYSELQEGKDYLRLIKERKIDVGKNDVEQLERDLRVKESDMLRKSKSLGRFTHDMTMTWNDIEAALNKDDVAIEFTGFTVEDSVRYVALVIRKGFTSPKLVSICTKRDIKSIKEDDYYQTSQLYETIWKPLEKYISGCKNIYFTPEGILYNIAIEYAVDGNGTAMTDNYHMYRLSSTREIAKDKNVINLYKSALFGGLQYTLDNAERERIKQIYNDSISHEIVFRDSPNIRDLRESMQELPPLPGALKEVEAIADIMKSHHHPVALETGTEGTEEAFKLLSGKHVNTLHISTHGFYDEEGEETSIDDEDKESSSLSRSGLFMSGASDYLNDVYTSTDTEDGILTSKEISKMDLRGLDLVVLSACRTALGDISSEGVSGLQRGFKKAGANSILMSLWKVDDEATCLLMTEFYKNWIGESKTKREALELAKQTVCSHKEKGWDDPKYWAAFILLDAIE